MEIKNQSNKDMRSAIMTLQFKAIPRLGTVPGKRAKVESSKKKSITASSKDFSLSVF